MHKKFLRFLVAALALSLCLPSAGAVNTNRDGDVMVRVGLASSSSHVPQGEMESANLENNNSAGYGEGFRFGYYDGDLDFVELARTEEDVIAVSVLKTQNLSYSAGENTYSSAGDGRVEVGCYHLLIEDGLRDYREAQELADSCRDGFVAWIDGEYQVRAGSYPTKEDAEDAFDRRDDAVDVVGTSSYGMSVVETGTDRILFQYDCGALGALGIQPDVTGCRETRTWFNGMKYRGGFQYHRRSGNNLTVVNVVELEDYVNGVICYEMGREWPLEALKAQALCARTYVLQNLGKHNSYGFDICNSSSCQVYNGMGSNRSGYGPSETSMRAVDETEGEVILYGGELIEVAYSSSFGGASEDANNVWGTDTTHDHPYLCGVEDPYESALDSQNSHAHWTVSYTAGELASRLHSRGYGVGSSVDYLELEYSELGNVIELVVHWTNGQSSSFYPSLGAGIRSNFGVDSIRFTVNGETVSPRGRSSRGSGEIQINGSDSVSDLDGLYTISGGGEISRVDGDPYVITGSGSVAPAGEGGSTSGGSNQGGGTVTVSGRTYVFEGGGWGHQIGMSQYGANAMARAGFTGEEIVEFYFPGTRVGYYD